jgi:hypothetical protein
MEKLGFPKDVSGRKVLKAFSGTSMYSPAYETGRQITAP